MACDHVTRDRRAEIYIRQRPVRRVTWTNNHRFYPNLAQYVMYLSATLKKERGNFHFARCKIFHSGIILNKIRKVQNVIKKFNCACCRIHHPLLWIRQRIHCPAAGDSAYTNHSCFLCLHHHQMNTRKN